MSRIIYSFHVRKTCGNGKRTKRRLCKCARHERGMKEILTCLMFHYNIVKEFWMLKVDKLGRKSRGGKKGLKRDF